MKEYRIRVTERYTRDVRVWASSKAEAIGIIAEDYDNNVITLGHSDYDETTFKYICSLEEDGNE